LAISKAAHDGSSETPLIVKTRCAGFNPNLNIETITRILACIGFY
jgi:hypothetical protein